MFLPGARKALNPIRPSSRMVSAPKSVPAPIGGWVTAQNLAASSPNTCVVLDNCFPTTKGIRVRGGNQLHATVGAEPVESLIGYVGASISAMFAASDGGIFDITSPADPEVAPTPDVTGQTADYYSSVNMTTSGGYFLYAVNGADDALLYDGATWAPIDGVSTPAITGATTSSFSHVNVYRNRLYFVEGNSLNVHYLPVDSIGGAVGTLSLAGIFRRGGTAYFTATWSSESGSSALSDYMVVVSSEGEAAIFQGSFPGGTDWSLVGTYEISEPLGINAWFKAGGDIVILTVRGAIPVSAARYKDPAALNLDAVSRAIEPTWKAEALSRRVVPWEVAKWDAKGAYYVNVPVTSTSNPPIAFVGNLQTGALCRYTGWDMRSLLIHNEQLYFGSNDGTVRTAEIGGYDLDVPYNGRIGFAWDHMGSPGFVKTVKQARAEFITTQPFAVQISDSVDYITTFPTAPNVTLDSVPSSLWDIGQFDVAVWDAGEEEYPRTTHWMSVGTTGRVHSMQIQIPIGSVNTPSAELIMLHITSDQGGLTV